MTKQMTDLVGDWLQAFKRTSLVQEHARIGDARFHLLKLFLNHMGEERFASLSTEMQITFCKAVGIEVPRSEAVKPYVPGPRQAVAERPAASIFAEAMEGLKDLPNKIKAVSQPVTPDAEWSPGDIITPRGRLVWPTLSKPEGATAEKWQANLDAHQRLLDANAAGQLWTYRVALYDENRFILIHQGDTRTEDWDEAFDSQHTGAWAKVKAAVALGPLDKVRSDLVSHFSRDKSDKEITIRTILKG